MTKNPANDWTWDDYAEEAFVEWFHGDYGPFTLRSEYFYGDAEIGDVKTRKDMMYKWLHSSYVAGYNVGRYEGLEAGLTSND